MNQVLIYCECGRPFFISGGFYKIKCSCGRSQTFNLSSSEYLQTLGQNQQQNKSSLKHEEQKLRIQKAVIKLKNHRKWITSLKDDKDIGLGDTISRLIDLFSNNPKRKELLQELIEMQKVCSCHRDTATNILNRDYPYKK